MFNEQTEGMSPDAFDSMLSGIDKENPVPPATEPEASQVEVPNTTMTTTTEPASTTPTPSSETDTGTLTDPATVVEDKSNKAFAQMRVRNKAYENVLQTILSNAGLDASLAKDPDAVIALLQDAATEQQAEELNVPAEVLKRMNELERSVKANEAEKLRTSALQGFAKVKETFKLTDKDLGSFAAQLQNAGLDPFTQSMDLEMQYKLFNMDKIIAKANEEAVAAALARQQEAYKHSTTPQAKGTPPAANNDGKKVTNMAEFNRLLGSISL